MATCGSLKRGQYPVAEFSPKIGKISPATGSTTEYAVPDENTFPLGITTGSDGNLWFTENGDNIGKISPTDGKITEYQILGVNSQPILFRFMQLSLKRLQPKINHQ